jgi:hypothetical protein
MNVHFQFSGFEPSQVLTDTANHTLRELLELIPADASHNAYFTKSSQSYECRVEIFSHSGRFLAESQSDEAEEALQDVDLKVREFLRDWHNTRCVDPSMDLWPFSIKHGSDVPDEAPVSESLI